MLRHSLHDIQNVSSWAAIFYQSSFFAFFYPSSWTATRWRIHIQTGTMSIMRRLGFGFFVAQLLRMTFHFFAPASLPSSLFLHRLFLFSLPTPLFAPTFATMFSPLPRHPTIHIRHSPQTPSQYSLPHRPTFPFFTRSQTIAIFWLQNKNNCLI